MNLEALNKWVGHIPEDVVKDMANIAPMLQTLGYDPNENPPNYGKPDPKVADNTLHIQQNVEFWKKREAEILKRFPEKMEMMAPGPPQPQHPKGAPNKPPPPV